MKKYNIYIKVGNYTRKYCVCYNLDFALAEIIRQRRLGFEAWYEEKVD